MGRPVAYERLPEYLKTDELKNPLIVNIDQLKDRFQQNFSNLVDVSRRYPFRITPYFLSMIKSPDDALGRQVIPDEKELEEEILSSDPLCEEKQSPVSNLIHRYPDRALFLVSDRCAMYCRYCMRKRNVGGSPRSTQHSITESIGYIKRTPAIREVILSGGDPLMLSDRALEKILTPLKNISHVEVIRIHTRIPCAMPERITRKFSEMLARFHPLFINIQFNHPNEITDAAAAACGKLTNAGIALGSQSVLLKGINDDPLILKNLFTGLLRNRVKPYYLHHPDVVQGTAHFRVPLSKGLEILSRLRGHISGMAMPHYMIDLPGGGGKIPLEPEYIKERKNGFLRVKGFDGKIYAYPEN